MKTRARRLSESRGLAGAALIVLLTSGCGADDPQSGAGAGGTTGGSADGGAGDGGGGASGRTGSGGAGGSAPGGAGGGAGSADSSFTRYDPTLQLSPVSESVLAAARVIAQNDPSAKSDVFMKVGASGTVSKSFMYCFAGDAQPNYRVEGADELLPSV